MKLKNYYEILEVNRRSSKEDIRISYRKLAKKYHPDMNSSIESESKFKDITEAYDTLTNMEKRKKYDKQVSKLGYGFTELDPTLSNVKYELKSGVNVINDLLTTILGFKKDDAQNFGDIDNSPRTDKKLKQKPEKGSDIITHLEVSLEEGFFGIEKKIAIKSFKTGLKTFCVNVPIGIKSGDKIRLAALGNPGKNGGKNGDLIIHVKLIENSDFKLDGLNIQKQLTITPSIAAIGGNKKIEIFKEKILVNLPKHLKDGEIVNIANKGYILENGTRGNLLLKIHVDMPDNISEREEKLYEQLLKLENKKKM